MVGTFVVREGGKNAMVGIHSGAIVRVIKKRIGKDDVVTIPIRSVSSVHHDRKTFGSDVVTVTSAGQKHVWKINESQLFLDELNLQLSR